MYAVLFFATISGALWAVWWRIEGKVDRAKEEALRRADAAQSRAETIAMDLAAHRLHSAEVFATKQGMQEQTAQLLRAIEGVGNRIDGMNERLDRAFEHPHVAPPRRRVTT
jgi:hypothetical protein